MQKAVLYVTIKHTPGKAKQVFTLEGIEHGRAQQTTHSPTFTRCRRAGTYSAIYGERPCRSFCYHQSCGRVISIERKQAAGLGRIWLTFTFTSYRTKRETLIYAGRTG